MTRFLLGVGSNLGDRRAYVQSAIIHLKAICRVITVSSLYETLPIGQADNTFLNGALIVESQLSPLELLKSLKKIESSLGRETGVKWGNRPIDLDILMAYRHGKPLVFKHESLKIPHPSMLVRSFVMKPAGDIASEWIHPVTNTTIKQLRLPFI